MINVTRATTLAGAAALVLVAVVFLPANPGTRSGGDHAGIRIVGRDGSSPIAGRAPGRFCGRTCRHVARPADPEALSHPGELLAELGGGTSESVRLAMPGGSWTVTNLTRARRGDGRTVVSGRTADGGVLFAVTDGLAWEGRLLWLDRSDGWLFRGDAHGATAEARALSSILCSDEHDGRFASGLPALAAAGPAFDEALAGGEVEGDQVVPILNSLSEANGVIYLDFDGETVSGTNYNSVFTNGEAIVAGAASFSSGQIQTIWEHVAEDFRPFNVNVTTDRAAFDAAPGNRRVQVIFTPDNEWYGRAGGLAFLHTFGSSSYEDPAWVFSDQATYNGNPHPPYAAEAASHEAGHTLGLSHDGRGNSTYYYGHGIGTTRWAPIMGVGYHASVTQWSRGDYPDATNTEDDLAVISGPGNGLGYRADDYPDSTGAAGEFPLIANGGLLVHAAGIIERNTDVDVFKVRIAQGEASFTAQNDPADPNLDLKLRLLDATGAEVAASDPPDTLDGQLSVSVEAGTYYLEVSGVGTGTPETGYSDYGSLGAYVVDGILPESSLTAAISSPSVDAISLPMGTDLVLEGVLSGGEPEWEAIASPPGGAAVFANPALASTDCAFTSAGLYLIRFRTVQGSEAAAADLWVSVEDPGAGALHPNRGTGIELGPDGTAYQDSVVLAPLLDDDGVPGTDLGLDWSVVAGGASLSDPSAANPVLTFASSEAVVLRLVVDDGEIRTCGEVLLTGKFHEEVLVAAGGSATVHVPASGELDSLWMLPEFDDRSWRSGPLGAGFNAHTSPSELSLYGALLGSGMDLEETMWGAASSCYLRVPFELPIADAVLQMTLRMHFDDGFVAYLNGVEVARANAPAGSPAWDSVASSDRSGDAGETAVDFPLAIPDGLLVDGTNVLAVHGLNSSADPSDCEFLIAPELVARLSTLPFLESVAVIEDPGQRGLSDDPDGDGQDNLQEHAAGTNPAVAQVPAALDVRAGETAGKIDVCLRLPAPPLADVRYELEYRPELPAAWSTVAVRSAGGPWSGAQPFAVWADGPAHEVFVFDEAEIAQAYWRLKVVRVSASEAPLIAD